MNNKGEKQYCSVCGKRGHKKAFHSNPPTKKTCIDCKKTLPIEEFYINNGRNNNWFSKCKKCNIEDHKKRYNSSPERRAVILWNSAKSRSKKENISFSITTKDLVEQYQKQNGKCYYSGKQMTYQSGDKDKMSVDRIDPLKGYTIGNIVLCCWQINDMKKNYTEGDFLSLCKQIYDFSTNRYFPNL